MFGLNGNDQIVRAVRDGGWRAFECPLPDVYCLFARRSTGQVYDVGANTGFYSLVAVTANRGVTVHAFEPARDVVSAAGTQCRVMSLSDAHHHDRHRRRVTRSVRRNSSCRVVGGGGDQFVAGGRFQGKPSGDLPGAGHHARRLLAPRRTSAGLDDQDRRRGARTVGAAGRRAAGGRLPPGARRRSAGTGATTGTRQISAVPTTSSTSGSAPPNSSSATRSAGTRRPGTTSSSPGNGWTATSPRWPRSVSG